MLARDSREITARRDNYTARIRFSYRMLAATGTIIAGLSVRSCHGRQHFMPARRRAHPGVPPHFAGQKTPNTQNMHKATVVRTARCHGANIPASATDWQNCFAVHRLSRRSREYAEQYV